MKSALIDSFHRNSLLSTTEWRCHIPLFEATNNLFHLFFFVNAEYEEIEFDDWTKTSVIITTSFLFLILHVFPIGLTLRYCWSRQSFLISPFFLFLF